jgi:tRNA uridine 5-carboxymethylaminomethyl modification enzyme
VYNNEYLLVLVHCTQTYTNPETHRIVMENEHLLPKYDSFPPNVNNVATPRPAGDSDNDGIGPRYCPSLYLKVKRFAKRDRHIVWLEPEGLAHRTNLVYPVWLINERLNLLLICVPTLVICVL